MVLLQVGSETKFWSETKSSKYDFGLENEQNFTDVLKCGLHCTGSCRHDKWGVTPVIVLWSRKVTMSSCYIVVVSSLMTPRGHKTMTGTQMFVQSLSSLSGDEIPITLTQVDLGRCRNCIMPIKFSVARANIKATFVLLVLSWGVMLRASLCHNQNSMLMGDGRGGG